MQATITYCNAAEGAVVGATIELVELATLRNLINQLFFELDTQYTPLEPFWVEAVIDALPIRYFVRIPSLNPAARCFYEVATAEDGIRVVDLLATLEGDPLRSARLILYYLADHQIGDSSLISLPTLTKSVEYFLGLSGGEKRLLPENVWDQLRTTCKL